MHARPSKTSSYIFRTKGVVVGVVVEVSLVLPVDVSDEVAVELLVGVVVGGEWGDVDTVLVAEEVALDVGELVTLDVRGVVPVMDSVLVVPEVVPLVVPEEVALVVAEVVLITAVVCSEPVVVIAVLRSAPPSTVGSSAMIATASMIYTDTVAVYVSDSGACCCSHCLRRRLPGSKAIRSDSARLLTGAPPAVGGDKECVARLLYFPPSPIFAATSNLAEC